MTFGSELDVRQTKPPADDPAVPEQLLDLIRMRRGADVEILRPAADEQIAHAAADEVGGVLELTEPIQHLQRVGVDLTAGNGVLGSRDDPGFDHSAALYQMPERQGLSHSILVTYSILEASCASRLRGRQHPRANAALLVNGLTTSLAPGISPFSVRRHRRAASQACRTRLISICGSGNARGATAPARVLPFAVISRFTSQLSRQDVEPEPRPGIACATAGSAACGPLAFREPSAGRRPTSQGGRGSSPLCNSPGFGRGGLRNISPLLANIYLHTLDRCWSDQTRHDDEQPKLNRVLHPTGAGGLVRASG